MRLNKEIDFKDESGKRAFCSNRTSSSLDETIWPKFFSDILPTEEKVQKSISLREDEKIRLEKCNKFCPEQKPIAHTLLMCFRGCGAFVSCIESGVYDIF